mgnify:CR=1 FL=1
MLEACLLVPAAVIYVLWLNQTGAGHFLAGNEVLALALIGTGFVTSVPMIAFAYAVQNLPMTVFGFCQYLNPILTMTVGLVIFGEPFNDAFAVPLALVLAAVAALQCRKSGRQKARQRRVCMPTGKLPDARHPAETAGTSAGSAAH